MFNEKLKEYDAKTGQELPVVQSARYRQSRDVAVKFIKEHGIVGEEDFWILMNKNNAGTKMNYSGLIISHNGCLKINDAADEKRKFMPECVSVDKSGYKDSLVFTYSNPAQGLYEVGEVSAKNCKNEYPYAMGLKRLFDRVVLKLCKLAYSGIYSDSEAEEFKEPEGEEKSNADKPTKQSSVDKPNPPTAEQLKELDAFNVKPEQVATYLKKTVEQLTSEDVEKILVKKRKAATKAAEESDGSKIQGE